jgi:gamma-glutamylcyclotransferase
VTNSMKLLHYFAYGSNLHPVRLCERVPSAQLVGTSQLAAHRVHFHKRGQDSSGKCNLLHTGQATDQVHGAIYSIDAAHKTILDEYEGPGYRCCDITVQHGATRYECFVYLAYAEHIDEKLKPYHWYRDLVIQGARYLGFPEAYIQQLANVSSVDDPDQSRQQQHTYLLEKMTIK